MKLSPILVWCKRKSETQDGVSQTGILLSQPAHNVAAQFQGLTPGFQGPRIQWSYSLYCVMQAEFRNPRWRLQNRNTLISDCTYLSCTIPRDEPMFSGSKNSVKLFSILYDSNGSQRYIAEKEEIIISVSNIAAHFQRLYSCFSGSRNSMKLFLILCDACGIQKFKIAQILKTHHWIWLSKMHDCALNGMIRMDE